MIDSRIYIKSLNATEAGETNTNDSYILIPKGFDASDFFDLTEGNKKFFDAIDPESNKKYNLRFEVTSKTKEQRIYKLGVFCREKGLHAGDTISIEHLVIDGESSFIIRSRHLENIVLLQKFKGDYIIGRNDLGDSLFETPLTLKYNGYDINLTLSFKERAQKRSDSPDEYDVYEAKLATGQRLSEVNKDGYIIIDIDDRAIIPFEPTKEYRITQE